MNKPLAQTYLKMNTKCKIAFLTGRLKATEDQNKRDVLIEEITKLEKT